MIVKNEEANLAKCLMSVRPVVDEMIVVDTGSSDRSKGIAAALGARVFEYPWTNDFSEARNYSLAQASGDWILVLDADECLAPMDGALLTKTVKNSKNKEFAYRMITRNYTNQAALRGWTANNGEYYGIEAGEGWIPSVKVRLFPNREGIAFVGAVHELVEPTLSRLRMRMKDCNVPVHHYGKLDPAKVNKKGPEYYRLGIKKIEDTNAGYHALKELAIQASELEEYQEAVKIWENVIATNPTDAPAYLNAGYACFMLKQYEKAAILSNKALELAPDLREAALNLAGCEFMLGNVQCAISLLETILAKEPDYPPAMGRLAAVYLIDGRKEEGFKYIRNLNQRNYNAIQLIKEQAQALDAQGRADHAMRLHAAIRQFNEHSQNEFLLDSKRPQSCVEGNSETPHLACSNIVQLGGQALGVD
jgi:tetratricopeptide (TPR) repeat protein